MVTAMKDGGTPFHLCPYGWSWEPAGDDSKEVLSFKNDPTTLGGLSLRSQY